MSSEYTFRFFGGFGLSFRYGKDIVKGVCEIFF